MPSFLQNVGAAAGGLTKGRQLLRENEFQDRLITIQEKNQQQQQMEAIRQQFTANIESAQKEFSVLAKSDKTPEQRAAFNEQVSAVYDEHIALAKAYAQVGINVGDPKILTAQRDAMLSMPTATQQAILDAQTKAQATIAQEEVLGTPTTGGLMDFIPNDPNQPRVSGIERLERGEGFIVRDQSGKRKPFAFNPEEGQLVPATRREATGTAAEFGLVSKGELEDLRGTEVAYRQFSGEVSRLMDQLDSPDALTGGASTVISTLNSMSGFVQQLTSTMTNGQVDDSGLNDPAAYDDQLTNWFGEEAAQSAGFRSNIVNIAYVMARLAQPGDPRLSNADVENQLRSLSASTSSKEAIKASLLEASRRMDSSLRAQWTVIAPGQPMPKELLDTMTFNDLVFMPEHAITQDMLRDLSDSQLRELMKRRELVGK